jgi:hypothetical protein
VRMSPAQKDVRGEESRWSGFGRDARRDSRFRVWLLAPCWLVVASARDSLTITTTLVATPPYFSSAVVRPVKSLVTFCYDCPVGSAALLRSMPISRAILPLAAGGQQNIHSSDLRPTTV